MEIKKGSIGPEANYDLEMRDGRLFLTMKYGGADVNANLSIDLGTDALLEKLKAAIPGTIDDTIIDILKAAMK